MNSHSETNILELLPLEIIEEIATELDYKSLLFFSRSSSNLISLCRNTYILKKIIRKKGYWKDLSQTELTKLRFLCKLLGYKDHLPGKVNIIGVISYDEKEVADPSSHPELRDIVQVSFGHCHMLCLNSKGEVYGFGRNDMGQLGLGDEQTVYKPSLILSNIVQVLASYHYSLCIRDDGCVYGFGINSYGQLGFEERFVRYTPELIPNFENIRQVVGCKEFSVFLTKTGQVYVARPNTPDEVCRYGVNKPIHVESLNNIVQVSCGQSQCLCLTDEGQVYAFGNSIINIDKQRHCNFQRNPGLVPVLKNIVQVSCGAHHSLCLRDDGRVYAFGENGYGQLGLGNYKFRRGPKLIPRLYNIIQVSGGNERSLCLTKDGQVYIFGHTHYHKLGSDGQLIYDSIVYKHNTIKSPVPIIIPNMNNIIEVFCGEGYDVVIKLNFESAL